MIVYYTLLLLYKHFFYKLEILSFTDVIHRQSLLHLSLNSTLLWPSKKSKIYWIFLGDCHLILPDSLAAVHLPMSREQGARFVHCNSRSITCYPQTC